MGNKQITAQQRQSHFSMLTEDEIGRIEAAIQAGHTAGGAGAGSS